MKPECSPIEAARWYCSQGFLPVPVPYRSKDVSDGSRILGWQDWRITLENVTEFFSDKPQNIGILTGDEYGTTDIDLDSFEAISAARLLLPETGMIWGRTSKPVSHYIYRSDPPIRYRKFNDPTRPAEHATILEIRGQASTGKPGHQTVAPPSIHQDSGELIWFEPGISKLPANIRLKELERAAEQTASAALLARHWPARGCRHEAGLALGGMLARGGMPIDEAKRFGNAMYRSVPTHDSAKVHRIETEIGDSYRNLHDGRDVTGFNRLSELIDVRVLKDVTNWLHLFTGRAEKSEHVSNALQEPGEVFEPPDLLHQLHNDCGNAERLLAMYRNDLWYCHAFHKWPVFDGMRWCVDETDRARRLAKQTMLEFLRQAIAAKNEAAEKFARGSLDARRISSLLSMAECEIPIRPAQLDTDPYALNFLNGTVDLRTGVLRAHDRADLITKLIPYEYRPDAQCPRWLAFLYEVMGGGPDASEGELQRAARLVMYLQRAIGYSLTGCTIEKAVFVVFGDGNNGKSTTLSTIRQLVEEYAVLLQADTLMVRQESNNTQADLADLRGARFVQSSETEEGQRLAQGKLKRITQGMGKIKAVRKYENPIEFPETHKLWMDTNRKPTIRDADDRATFNRLHPIPFTVRIPDERIDKDLPVKLLAEAKGILAWAVDGARQWAESGLDRPPEISAAREQWHADADQVGRFIDACCITGEAFRVAASALYAAYKSWAETGGEHPLPSKSFGEKVPNHGFGDSIQTAVKSIMGSA